MDINLTVIILIIAHKEKLEPYERISLQQCFKILGHYPIKFICPEGLDISEYLSIDPRVTVDFITPHWLGSYENFNKLKRMPFLFERYKKFEYALFYEPDAFVFRDDLLEWCGKGYDYIGAPWLKGWSEATADSSFVGVGNGGFSLRKISSVLKVVHSAFYMDKPIELRKKAKETPSFTKNIYNALGMNKTMTITYNTSLNWFVNFERNEDGFWGFVANRNFKWFTVAPPEVAMRFSFEVQPKALFERNNQRLPFGCHAWWKYDLDFWRPFISGFGYEV